VFARFIPGAESARPAATPKPQGESFDSDLVRETVRYGGRPQTDTEQKAFDAGRTGLGVAVKEPVYGAAGWMPGAIGRWGASGAEDVRKDWERAVNMDPLAAYTGYGAGQVGMLALPAGSAAKAGSALGAMGRGAATGAAYGALTPSEGETWGERAADRAPEIAKGAAIGGAIPGAVRGAQAIPGMVRGVSRVLEGAPSREALESLAGRIKSGQIADKIMSGEEQVTAGMIKSLQDQNKINTRHATETLEALYASQKPELMAFRQARDVATRDAERATQGFASAPETEQIGQSLLSRVNTYISGLKGDRSSLSKAFYGDVDKGMLEAHRAGDTFVEHESGAGLVKTLEHQLTPEGSAGASKEAQDLIRNYILPNIRGARVETTEGAQAVETAKAAWAKSMGQPYEKPAEFVPKEPLVIREVVRKLRDAAGGRPEEGYAAIGQERAKQYANLVADSLEEWHPGLRSADAQYQKLSEALDPAKTLLGRKATATERFDPDRLVMDASAAPGAFFKTPETVRQLVTLSGGDRGPVEIEALNWARRELSDKTTPAARQKWLKDAEWMSETPRARQVIKQDVERLNKATEAAEQTSATFEARRDAALRVVKSQRAATEAADTTKTQTTLQSALNDFRTDLDRLAKTVDTAENPLAATKEIRDFLNKDKVIDRTPASVLKELKRELAEIEQLQSREKMFRALRTLLGRGAAVAAGVPHGATHVARTLGVLGR
jgi:hypothetical protein